MEREGERYRRYTRRALLVAGAQGVLTAVVLGRMYYLGVLQADDYALLAEENRVSLRLLTPTRGEILDRKGKKLATNRKDYRVFLIPEQAIDVVDTLQSLGRIISISERDVERLQRQISRQRSFFPVTVAQNLSWKEFARINVESSSLPGIQPDAGETRFYPEATRVSHILGYVGVVAEEEMSDDPVLQIPGFRIGKSGVERQFDLRLRGTAGDSRVEVNAFGRVIREIARQEGVPGDDVVLTLDLEMQQYVMQRLGEDSAAVVVLDAQNGDILVSASSPSFDINSLNMGISQENWQALLDDPRNPIMNKCVQGQYPPGSTFKMVVALAALEAGVWEKNKRVFCNGKYDLGDRTFHCWKKEGHGRLDLINAISQSCDIYFYKLAQAVGIDLISEMARKLGFGRAYDIGIGVGREGLVPSRAWKLATQGSPWQVGETLIVGIGQGALLATPLQLAIMTARLATGRVIEPRLIHAIGGEIQPQLVAPLLDINHRNLLPVLKGMEKVLEEGGTAYASRLRGEGFSMAGKTGTSQVRAITLEEREAGTQNLPERPWKERDHALFVAYGPREHPRYSISVIVEHGGGGSSVAGPIIHDIMQTLLELDPASDLPVVRQRRAQISNPRSGGK